MSRRFSYLLIVVGLLLNAPSPRVAGASVEAGGRASVILITVDTLRPDRLSAYGYTKRQTPGIDSVAQRGALFENSVTDIPWTTGALASVMTGTYGNKHGLRLPNDKLSDSRTTLAEILEGYGYSTAAIVGSYPVSSLYGLNQGFDSYDEEFTHAILAPQGAPQEIEKIPNPDNFSDEQKSGVWAIQKIRNDSYRPDPEVTRHAVQWLSAVPKQPFFLWVHYFGPHERLYDGATFSSQEPRIVSDYDRDLQATDVAVKTLLEAIGRLGLSEKVLVILHADHGQSLGEHDYVGHSNDLYEVSIRVPLLMRFPARIPPATRVNDLVHNIDILPTILDLIGLPIPPGVDGRSLVPLLRGASLPAASAYVETYMPKVVKWPIYVPGVGTVIGPTARMAIISGRWKLVENQVAAPCTKGSSPHRSINLDTIDKWELADETQLPDSECNELRVDELYDLYKDPSELHDVSATQPDVVGQLQAALRSRTTQQKTSERAPLSAADEERLRSLGYHTRSE